MRVTRVSMGLGARGLVLPPHPCYRAGVDTSTTPYISPVLDRRLSANVGPYEVIQLARDIVTETTNDIRDFEGEGVSSRIDVALRRLIDRVEADEAFMTELAD